MEQSYNKKLLQQAVTDGREAKELYENRITKDFIEQLKRFHYESFLRHDIDSDAEGKRLMFIRMRAEVFEEFEKYLMITITEG